MKDQNFWFNFWVSLDTLAAFIGGLLGLMITGSIFGALILGILFGFLVDRLFS